MTTATATQATDGGRSTAMTGTIRSEWIRIWRPSFRYGGIGLLTAFSVLISLFIYSSLSDASASDGPGFGATTAADLEQPGGMLHAVGSVSTLAGIVLLSLWAIAAASDYDTGLIRVLVQAEPSRIKLLSAKIIALTAFTVLATAITVLSTAAIARPLARFNGVDTDPWKVDTAVEMAKGSFNFLIPALVWGLIGLTVAVLTKSSGTAIGVGIGWLLVVENLIGIAAPDITDFLPGGTLNAVASGGTEDLSWAAALGITALYGIAASAASLATFNRRDIVD